ncbi:MAG: four helix bundle protein, partial [Candidatus Doudnabacteria bacterium]|nr:four helix bundle protein [Candidatus Doudnabacteria bacterium]
AISIPSNIAEGWSRNRNLEFIRFLEIAYSSACELETQLLISKDQYSAVDYESAEKHLLEVKKMLFGLILSKKPKSAY